MNIELVERSQLMSRWPQARGFIAAACRHSEHTQRAPRLLRACIQPADKHRMLCLWDGQQMVGALVLDESLADRIHITSCGMFTGNELGGRVELLQAWLIAYCNRAGKRKLQLQGRRGWERVLHPLGWVKSEHNLMGLSWDSA